MLLAASDFLVFGVLALSACSASVPDARSAATNYAAAIEAKDAEAVHALLDKESQRVLGQKRVAVLLRESQQELEQRAKGFADPGAEVRTQADLRLKDGSVVSLELEGGQFRISSAMALPSAANTPLQALHELRAALSRRSYIALLYLLSTETRDGLETQVHDLAKALEHPETLDIKVRGDRATVTTPSGHRVEIQNEDGVWKIHDFE